MNPFVWRGLLSALLPKLPKLTRGHYPAMPFADVPAFGFAELLRTLPPHFAELPRTLPPQLPIDWACELRPCSKAYMYDRIGLKHVAAVNNGRHLRIITASLLSDMVNLPAADIKPTARLQSRLAALENASRRRAIRIFSRHHAIRIR